MREPTKESPSDRGLVEVEGRCQVCGEQGRVLAILGSPPPNEFCARCAVDYGDAARDEEIDEQRG